ncbi:MAG: Uma2 family endonuclease [Thermoanaerobaculia bacterium]
MAKRAWKIPPEESEQLDPWFLDDEQESYLERCVERPDGTVEFLSIPLTPEDFLNPQLGDKWVQGRLHGRACLYFADILERHFSSEEDVLVLYDVKLLTDPRRKGPVPDVMVVRGARNPDPDLDSFDPVEQGASLVVEVLSQTQRIRKKDQEDKVALYARAGIPDYLLVDPPRRRRGNLFQLKGYRLGPEGSYLRTQPDAQGCLLCASVGLRFGVSARGDQMEVFDARTGERLLSSREEEAGRKAAEERADRETEAREAAEAEVERLRAEILQLKMSGR